jgi:hypothetical protein
MNKTLKTVYVKLVGEQVDVWRPVQAEHLGDDIYLIVDQPYDRDSETWQFGPGSSVICELVESADGPILGATDLHIG